MSSCMHSSISAVSGSHVSKRQKDTDGVAVIYLSEDQKLERKCFYSYRMPVSGVGHSQPTLAGTFQSCKSWGWSHEKTTIDQESSWVLHALS